MRRTDAIWLAALAAAACALLAGPATATAAAPPAIESESATNVAAADATLEAQIDPGGLETSYQFRLESGCPTSGLSCMAITVYSLPAGSIPASSGVQNVSLDLNDAGVTLQPSTEYRYGVAATNSAGPTVRGPDQTFTTAAPAAAATTAGTTGAIEGVTVDPPLTPESTTQPAVATPPDSCRKHQVGKHGRCLKRPVKHHRHRPLH